MSDFLLRCFTPIHSPINQPYQLPKEFFRYSSGTHTHKHKSDMHSTLTISRSIVDSIAIKNEKNLIKIMELIQSSQVFACLKQGEILVSFPYLFVAFVAFSCKVDENGMNASLTTKVHWRKLSLTYYFVECMLHECKCACVCLYVVWRIHQSKTILLSHIRLKQQLYIFTLPQYL